MTLEEKLERTEAERSSFHKRVVACSEQLHAMRKRAEKAEAKLADHDRICNQHMKNIKTWMPEGFTSHCTDAMLIMATERDELKAKPTDTDITIADLRSQLHVANAIVGDGDRMAGEREVKRIAEIVKAAEDVVTLVWDEKSTLSYAEKCKLTNALGEAVRRKRGE